MVLGERPPSPARLSHTSEKHPKSTLTELNVLRRHRELCDVVLNVGNRKIFAHRFEFDYLVLLFIFLAISLKKFFFFLSQSHTCSLQPLF